MNIMTQMKQYIVRMVLLCMVMMCGAGFSAGNVVSSGGV